MNYRAGLPGWKLAARAGFRINVRVNVMKDEEAGVYVGTSPDLSGLTVEAETLEELRSEVHGAAAKLLELALHMPARAKTEIRISDPVSCPA